jgi:hypothetical protein
MAAPPAPRQRDPWRAAAVGRSAASIADDARRRATLAGACAIRLSRAAMSPAVQAVLHEAQVEAELPDEGRGVLGAFALAHALARALGEVAAGTGHVPTEPQALARLTQGVQAALGAYHRLRARGLAPDAAVEALTAQVDGVGHLHGPPARSPDDEPHAFAGPARALAAPAWPPQDD